MEERQNNLLGNVKKAITEEAIFEGLVNIFQVDKQERQKEFSVEGAFCAKN